MRLIDQIKHLTPCEDAVDWLGDKTLDETWATCDRGDWLLWLYARAANYDKRKAVYVAALCANDVRHMMTDERSRHAVDVALAYGRGEVSDEDLNVARSAARAAVWVAARTDAWAAADAARAARAAAWDAADAEWAAARAARAAAWAAAREAEDDAAEYAAWAATEAAALKRYADLCREHLPMPELNQPAGERRDDEE